MYPDLTKDLDQGWLSYDRDELGSGTISTLLFSLNKIRMIIIGPCMYIGSQSVLEHTLSLSLKVVLDRIECLYVCLIYRFELVKWTTDGCMNLKITWTWWLILILQCDTYKVWLSFQAKILKWLDIESHRRRVSGYSYRIARSFVKEWMDAVG